MLPPPDEYERFWQYLRDKERQIEEIKVELADLRLDLDSERKRSIAVHQSSGRNKWTSLIAAGATLLMAIAQWLLHK